MSYNDMKRNGRWLLLALLTLVAGIVEAQTRENILTVPNFEGRIDKTVAVPVYLSNTQEVVAAQFDVELPFSVPAGATATLTNRANQHSATINAKGGRKFSVVIMSMQNNALRGNSGLLLRLPMQTYDDGHTATPYPVRLTNIVLTDRQGNNIATNSQAEGLFSVSRADLPDLTVSSVVPLTTQVQPGEQFACEFKVSNDGSGNAHGGWSEKVYLESAQTGVRTYIGSMYHADSLQAGAETTRRFAAILPSLVHADGQQYVYVEITPDPQAGELLVDQGNNSGRSAQTLLLGKRLFVSANKQDVAEGWKYSSYSSYRDYILLTVARSGDWSVEESFPLTCSVDGLLSAGDAVLSTTSPRWVTIPARSASTTVRIYAVEDQIVRAREAYLLIGESNGYEGSSLRVSRTDNDRDPLSLNASLSTMTEGTDKQLVLTATRGGEMAQPLELTVACSQASRFSPYPVKITIPKGKPSGTATVTLIDDDTPQPDVKATFSTQAADYASASAALTLNDDDRPAITLTLHPGVVSENSGSQATTALVSRDRGYDKDGEVSIRLSSSAGSEAYFADRTVTLGKGEKEKEVKVGVTDNSAVDGQRSLQLSAALYLPTTQTTAISTDRAHATATLTVTDDESPYLTVTSRSSLVGEGSSFKATVTRHVATTSSPQTVLLSADKASDAQLPATLTIPAGSRSADFTVVVNRNEQLDDERMLFINASSQGMGAGQLSVRITDRTLPDAVCNAIGYDGTQLYSGMPVTLTPEIGNVGTAELPANVQIDFFLANSDRLYSYTQVIPVFSAQTSAPIGTAESKTFRFEGQMPAAVGTYWLYARVNADGKIGEYSAANNVSPTPVRVTVAAPFSVSEMTVEQESYKPGDAVKVTGRVSTKQADGLKNQYVGITLSGNGQSPKTTTALVDAQTGAFTAYPQLSASANGIINVNARALGQTEADMTGQLNVWSLAVTADQTTWTLDEDYTKQGTLTICNNSGKRITGLRIEPSALPFGCELSLTPASTTLEPGATTTVAYQAKGTKSMTNGQYAHFVVKATTAEGATAELPVRYYCRATSSLLVFDTDDLSQTLLLQSQRTVRLKVTNKGKKASGAISMVVPSDLDWLVCKTASPMASIQPGKSDYVTFELKHQPGMHSGETFPAYLTLNAENGPSAGARMNVTVVGTEYSTLKVNVEDIFVKAQRNYQKVSAAQVSITDAHTGKQVMTGLTDGAGQWMTDRITQGTYYVTVSALRHKTMRSQLVIGPGDQRHLSFFLPYQAVTTDFVASQDLATGLYHLDANIDIDSLAPQAIVVPELPEDGFECGSQDFDLTLRNLGSFTAQDVQLVFPPMANATFRVGSIGSIAPGGEVVVPVRYEGPENGRRRTIASILMYYGYTIDGGYYSENDYYQSLVGCMNSDRQLPPVAEPNQPRPAGDQPDLADDDDDSQNQALPEPTATGIALPTRGSSVTLQFDDISRVSMGEPFYATLRIVNGQSAALRNISFSHTVSDDSDDFETDMTTLFTCEQTDAEGFSSQTCPFALSGQNEGIIRLAFTPTASVTADGRHTYYVGGQLFYTDAAQNFGQTVMLPQTALTVTQKGEASVVYLLQNEFLGNDTTAGQPMTAVPAQHVMLVRNEGQTDISNLQIVSSEPVAIDNKTSEPAALRMLSASIDQQPTNEQALSLKSDTLRPGTTTIGRWIMQSQRDSHLAATDSMEASVAGTAAGDLKLTVTGVHRLFRAVKDMYADPAVTDDDEANGQEQLLADLNAASVFLLDDEEDEDHLPDNVMLADGRESSLQVLSEQASLTGAGGTYTLTVEAKKAGWIYLRITDPTNGYMTLQTAERQGTLMSRANVWVTDHTVLSDYAAVSEYTLHLADSVAAGQTTYQLVFADHPEEPVRAMKCRLYTVSGAEVEAQATTTERVTTAVVEFTRNIQMLLKNRMTVFAAGQQQDMDSIDIRPLNGPANVWTIDLRRLAPVPGQHRITIDVAKLKEPKPSKQNGEGTCTIEWVEDITAQVPVVIDVATGDSTGSVSKQSGDYAYGPLHVEATPAEGYKFDYWEADGNRIEADGERLDYDVQQAVTLRAFFSKQLFSVTIECDGQEGIVSGAATGYYEWQQPLRLTAIPNMGYAFSHWQTSAGDSLTAQQLSIVVTADCRYKAVFYPIDTRVAELQSPRADASSIYSLSGQLLRTGVGNLKEALRSLPEGLYIVGGRKVLNRR